MDPRTRALLEAPIVPTLLALYPGLIVATANEGCASEAMGFTGVGVCAKAPATDNATATTTVFHKDAWSRHLGYAVTGFELKNFMASILRIV